MHLQKLVAILVIGFSATAFAQNEKQAERLAALLKKYPAADANKDGKLTWAEAKAFREKMTPNQTDKAERQKTRKAGIPEPTHANLKYGPHERNVIDVWLPEKAANPEKPIPMLVFFHGGGFVGGDKAGFDPQQYLEAGIAAASGNYRLVDGDKTLVSACLADSARALQFLKSKAETWNLDREKFAMSGNSAGAVITLYLGLHDDLAKPKSDDPIERESTRLAAIIPMNGPANLNPAWIREHLGGPPHVHGSYPKMYGPAWDTAAGHAAILKTSPWEFVSKDDPPTFLVYSSNLTEVPLPETASTGQLVHHPYFGQQLKTRLDDVGVPAKFIHSFDPRGKTALADFLKETFAE